MKVVANFIASFNKHGLEISPLHSLHKHPSGAVRSSQNPDFGDAPYLWEKRANPSQKAEA
jgi:hypothetical protein